MLEPCPFASGAAGRPDQLIVGPPAESIKSPFGRLAGIQAECKPVDDQLFVGIALLSAAPLAASGPGRRLQLWCLTAILGELSSPLIRSTGHLFSIFPRVQFSSSDNWRAAIVAVRVKVLDQAG